MEGFDLNIILMPLGALFGFVSLVSGIFLVARSFFRFRYQVNQSLTMDLEVIKVMRKKGGEGQGQSADAWKDEIHA